MSASMPDHIHGPQDRERVPVHAGSSRASAAERLEELRERMADLCASAVDPLEITAGLEADGINDEAARGYGHPDVFAVAEDLFAGTPRRPPTPEATASPWRPTPWRHLVRGVLFGLPGLCYIVATPALTRTTADVLLVFSLLLSWTVSQGTAYLGYVRLGLGDKAAAARVLRYGLAAGALVVVPVTAATGIVLDAGTTATALAAGLGAYLLAAMVVQVNGGERRLLLAFLPGVAGVVVYLAAHGGSPPSDNADGTLETVPMGVWVAWLATLAATIALAVVCTSGAGRPTRRVVTGRDVAAALPFSVFGLLTGGLLTFTLLCAVAGRPVPAGSTTVAVLSLSLSMGVAEWILYAYRRRVYHLLRTHTDMPGFARAARVTLGSALARYMASLTALVTVSALIAGLPTSGATLRVLGGFVGLGGAFFLALVLQACGRVAVALTTCACALAAEVAAAWSVPRTEPGTIQMAVAGALFLILTIYAGRVLSRATPHR
ncbi:hypothetical protein [Actinomadura rubrisoli]|uniref:Uncharacterized protein n=1 Tax=Actinomadura rubrisoli TaxID=2530368 RepID=A0A4R5ANI1_9ACTN|nr:hypothetical protein [Actinomadura rubrisoli]TDD73300.1 hypothetical protein E1298_34325 [Actinomadura rubrisoli]